MPRGRGGKSGQFSACAGRPAAAFLPLVDRARSFSVDPEDAGGPVLYRDGRAVGRIRYGNPELMEALNLADGLARSPASIASFLEAAGAPALELADRRVAVACVSG